MTAPIVIRGNAADWGGVARYQHHTSPQRRRPHSNSVERISAFFVPGVSHFDGYAAGRIGFAPNKSLSITSKSSRFKFIGAFTVPRHRPSHARVHRFQQSSRGLAQSFHNTSFPDAGELHEQLRRKGRQGVEKREQRLAKQSRAFVRQGQGNE